MPPVRSLDGLVHVAGFGLGAAALAVGLPSGMPPAWPTSGGVVSLGAPLAAFLLPTASAVTSTLVHGVCARSVTRDGDLADTVAVCDAIMRRVSLFVFGLHATVLAALLGLLWGRPWAAQLVPVMLGLTMIGVGNLLPRTRPNLALAIRTSRTLANRSCWMRTHRIAGYVVVASGIAVIAAAVTLPRPYGPAMILAVGPAAALGIALLSALDARTAARSEGA